MPMTLSGSCRCGAISFTLESHTPYPYQLCYCSICRKTTGGGGFAINIMGDAATMRIEGRESIGVYRCDMPAEGGGSTPSEGQRSFCTRCASALWLFDERWPALIHPLASVIDTPLPTPPSRVHLMLGSKPDWVRPDVGPDDKTFDAYPEQSIEDWHRSRGLWID